MKLNQNTKRKNKGMTLLELTVVILVLLSLISILFVGARAWKKGSDRAGCILNIRNVQQAVRGHQNMNPGSVAAITEADIFGATAYLKFLKCPESSDPASPTALVGYTFTSPAAPGSAGNIALACTINTTEHVASDTDQW